MPTLTAIILHILGHSAQGSRTLTLTPALWPERKEVEGLGAFAAENLRPSFEPAAARRTHAQ